MRLQQGCQLANQHMLHINDEAVCAFSVMRQPVTQAPTHPTPVSPLPPAAVCLDPSNPKAHYRRLQALRAAGMLQVTVRQLRTETCMPAERALCLCHEAVLALVQRMVVVVMACLRYPLPSGCGPEPLPSRTPMPLCVALAVCHHRHPAVQAALPRERIRCGRPGGSGALGMLRCAVLWSYRDLLLLLPCVLNAWRLARTGALAML